MGNGITKIAILTHLKTIRKSPNFFQNDSLLAAIATRIFPTARVKSTAGNFKKIFAAPTSIYHKYGKTQINAFKPYNPDCYKAPWFSIKMA